ncbi:MAG: 5'-methylthioadenosine/adenosylhomocysteine nucleosidase [candidate division Zixibacteria bacterium]|nr:5'-methylthioadenosine/adenosylhomocysteine nucleosidase [candidate division Zixibacteria bacterium]
MIGIIGAMAEEIELFRQVVDIKSVHKYARNNYVVGKLCGQEIVLLQSGIGKVNATIGTQIMIDRFDVEMIIFTGLAGGLVPNLSRGDIVVSNNVVQHDFNLTAFGRRFGELPDVGRMIEVDERLVKFACYAYDDVFENQDDKPKLFVGTICSGDTFVTEKRKIEWLQREFGAVAIEMEGAAVGYTCFTNDVKFVILRTISDTGGKDGADDFLQYLTKASENSFAIVKTMLTIMSYRDSLHPVTNLSIK